MHAAILAAAMSQCPGGACPVPQYVPQVRYQAPVRYYYPRAYRVPQTQQFYYVYPSAPHRRVFFPRPTYNCPGGQCGVR